MKSESNIELNSSKANDRWSANPLKARYELKYIISLPTLKQIKNQLKPYVLLDKHNIDSKPYRIESIYFDSRNFHFYHENIDGIKKRRKFRIRFYPSEGNDVPEFCSYEIKRRYNRVIGKSKIKLETEMARKIIDGENLSKLFQEKFVDNAVSNEILVTSKLMNLRPVVKIGYDRLAYRCKQDPTIRITFDTNIVASPPNFDERSKSYDLDVISKKIVVMEIKYRWSKPQWLRRIVSQNNCKIQRLSKYVNGVRTLKFGKYYPIRRRGYLNAVAINSFEN